MPRGAEGMAPGCGASSDWFWELSPGQSFGGSGPGVAQPSQAVLSQLPPGHESKTCLGPNEPSLSRVPGSWVRYVACLWTHSLLINLKWRSHWFRIKQFYFVSWPVSKSKVKKKIAFGKNAITSKPMLKMFKKKSISRLHWKLQKL